VVIADLNPLLRGWGNYFRTGNAATKARRRLRGTPAPQPDDREAGRNLRAGQARAWTEERFNGHGLYRLRGTVRYPKAT
jgi:RNA-directed DNA polymerase